MKERLDAIVLRKGWAVSKEAAVDLIREGDVRVNALVRTDPSVRTEFDRVTRALPGGDIRYVSRGGDKLKGALDFFGLSVTGQVVVDLGASTGGFTDCLLQEGAGLVWAVDVGKGLLDWRLRQDSRVRVVEGANVRHRGGWMPGTAVDGVVGDLSFISLRQVLASVSHLLRAGGWFLSLVKPQFETSPENVGRGGVVRNPAVRRDVLRAVLADLSVSSEVRGMIPSSIRGRKGNQEYFFLTRWKGSA